jgi:hypothetical protein
MTFSLIRFELAITGRKLRNARSLHQKESLICACESKIQSLYLSHCDNSEPIHWLAQHVTCVQTTELWCKIYGNEDLSLGIPPHVQARRDRIFLAAIDVVDISKILETERAARRWLWSLSGYLQYLPLAFLLMELCHRRQCEAVDHAWRVAEEAFERQGEQIKNFKSGEILTQLMAKARARNGRTIEWQSPESLLGPGFVSEWPATMAVHDHVEPNLRIDHATTFMAKVPDTTSTEGFSYRRDMASFSDPVYNIDAVPSSFISSDWNSIEA